LRSFFICFTGTDGSGKSTLADSVFRKLRSKKIKIKRTYGRHQYIISRLAVILGNRYFLKTKDMFADYEKYLKDKRESYGKSSTALRIYMRILKIEYLFQVLFKISLPLRAGYSVVSDRYVYDTVINDIAVDKGLTVNEISEMLSNFWSYIPKPDLVFLVEVPETVAIKRKNDIPSIGYLIIRNQLYRHLAATENNFISLDGTLPVDKLQERIFEILAHDSKFHGAN
jgi:thymidylate kinase